MANLFFIHTPLELFVAQQIINSEQLHNNIMLYGYEGSNKHYMVIYDTIIIDTMWQEKVLMEDVDVWATIHRRDFYASILRVRKRIEELEEIINRYNVKSLYFGDMNNLSCKFGSFYFKKKGLRICFFEEGAGHYVFEPIEMKGGIILNYLYGVLADIFLFMPVCHMKFGAYCFWKDLHFDKLPIDQRYSIRPFYNESFDKLVIVHKLFSRQLIEILRNDLNLVQSEESIFLMTTPVYRVIRDTKRAKEAYIHVLDSFFYSLEKSLVIYLKFHPSDQEEEREIVKNLILKHGLKFKIIGNNINVPVEYYLQYREFREIVSFYSATVLYNGYLFPKMQFYSLLDAYYKQCKLMGIRNLKRLEIILESEHQTMKSDFYFNPLYID